MIADINIRDYYNLYIENANKDLQNYTHLLHLNRINKGHARDYIKDNINIYEDRFSINLKEYTIEWVAGVYNPSEKLYNVAYHLFIKSQDSQDNVHLTQLIKYCQSIKNVYYCELHIKEAKTRTTVLYKDYHAIVRKYYTKVQEALLEGYGYHFTKGLGDMYIARFHANKKKKICDFDATNKKRQEILNKGLKLYDKNEAEYYKVNGWKYDGVPYIVYQNIEHIYKIKITNANNIGTKKINLEHIEYVNTNFRNKGFKQIASEITERNEIYTLPCDIKTKLNIILEFDKTQYVKFIRSTKDLNDKSHKQFKVVTKLYGK